MDLPIIEHKNKIIKIIIGALLFVVLLIYILNINGEYKVIYAFLIYVFLIRILFSLDKFNIKEIGTLSINSNDCKVVKNIGENSFYIYKDFAKTLISQTKPTDIIYGLSSNLFLKITLQNPDKEKIFDVLIKGRKAKQEIISILKKMYKNGINLKEYDNNENRAFLLKSKLSYEEIQNIKKECNFLSWS